jgi:uncharacterized protein (UPF0332 family)
MIEDKDIKNARKIITDCIKSGIIKKPVEGEVKFFLNKAEQALMTADCLIRISDNAELKKNFAFPSQFESYVWIINTSYYSMFYTATALLAFHGYRIKSEQGIHALTYNALIYYFLDNDKKLEKHILEKYQQVEKEAAELLQLAQEEARGHIERVKFEMEKRRIFTYYMGISAEKSKATTSFERAKEFLTLAKEMMIKQ